MSETTLTGTYKGFTIKSNWNEIFEVEKDKVSYCKRETIEECEKYIDGHIKRNSTFKREKVFYGHNIEDLEIVEITSIDEQYAWIKRDKNSNHYSEREKVYVKYAWKNSDKNKLLVSKAKKIQKQIVLQEKQTDILEKQLEKINPKDFYGGTNEN